MMTNNKLSARLSTWIAGLMMCVTAFTANAAPADKELLNNAQSSISEFRKYSQAQPFFDTAYGYVVFPSVGKGGFWVGGAYGQGIVYQGHSPMANAELVQVSVGLTFGGQAFSEIIFFENKATFDRFLNGNVELGAQASATVLTEGAAAHAGTTGTSASASDRNSKAYYVNGMSIFTAPKGGLMVEAALAGQKFNVERW